MPTWVNAACSDYIKRMPRELSLEMVEIKPEKRAAGNNTQNIQALEAKKLLEAAGDDFLITCDENGQQISSTLLADKLRDWQLLGKNISFVVGGADGLHSSILQRANYTLGLSKLTLAHAFVRVLLCEQLYRAHTINTQHPYHRE